MRKLFFLFCSTFLTLYGEAKSNVDSSKFVKLIILNDNQSRPMADTKNYFWRSNKLNVISFSGDLYFDLLKYRLTKGKKDSLVNDFSVAAAIIFSKNNISDTVYSDCFFRNYSIKNETFSATDNFLYKMFSPLYLGFYQDMRKGED